MVKKWVYRILALVLAVFMLVETRKYYITDVKAYAEAQAEQRAIWDAKGEIAKQLKEQQAQEQEEKKETVSVTIEEEKESEPVYEPSEATGDDFFLDLCEFSSWESGEYGFETGEKEENKRRLRYPGFIQIDCPEYCVILSEGYTLNFHEYDATGELIRSKEVVGGEVFSASKYGAFFSVTLKRNEQEKSLSVGQWTHIFADEIEIKICTKKWIE